MTHGPINIRFFISFLKDFISEYFKWSGKIPDDNDLLHMWVKGQMIKGELTFSSLVNNSS